jgi:arylsulfatase A-like enzyme
MTRQTNSLALWVLVPLAATAWGMGCARSHPIEVDPSPNVIIALVDTLRADHMRGTTPNIDRFASQSVLFERARSQASCTFPSVNSLLTSRHPAVFLFQPDGFLGIPEETVSLAEILRDHGYSTAAFSASPIVRAHPSKENPDGGYGRGFAVFDESCLFREAECVNNRALQWLRKARRPFFLYLHYMDPHDPYRTPRNVPAVFAETHDGPDFVRDGNPNPIADMVYGDGPDVAYSKRDIRHLLDLYDDEIRYFDGQFNGFLQALDDLGLTAATTIVLASDHGEEFMEHGEHVKHCRVLYDTSTRVPLLVRIPGVEGGRRIASAVQNLDVVPTILDYLEIVEPNLRSNGASLRDLISSGDQGPRVAFSNQGKWRSIDDGKHKLLLDAKIVEPQLFDLHADPLEHRDLYGPEHPAALDLEPRLIRWLELTEGGVGGAKALDAGQKTEERLRALGYLQ